VRALSFVCVLAAFSLSVPGGADAGAQQATERAVFALVVGSNQSPKPELGTLRFADDDAAKFHELFARMGRSTLLTVLDAESQETFAGLAVQTRPPTRDNLNSALEATFSAMAKAQRAGKRTAFYFVYGGHGDVGPGLEGYLYLGRDKLTRSALFREVIARSPADVNHVIIDACNAYYMVKRRGSYPDDEAGEDFSTLARSFLATADLSSYPNTGVLVSTSAEAKAHEWSLFGGGVFSHEVRSGLLGSADLDLDGEVSYDEIEAYVAAANSLVENPRARISFHAEAPVQNHAEPLTWLADASGRPHFVALELPADHVGRFHVEDGRGLRYLDFHKAGDGALSIWLMPGQRYYLQGQAIEVEIPQVQHDGPHLELAALDLRQLGEPQVKSRGAVDDALRKGLYALPFSSSFYRGYLAQAARWRAEQRAQREERAMATSRAAGGSPTRASAASGAAPVDVEASQTATPAQPQASWTTALPYAGWGAVGTGLLLGAGGGTALLMALDSSDRFDSAPSLDDKLDLQRQIELRGQVAAGLLAAGGGIATAGGVALLVDRYFVGAQE